MNGGYSKPKRFNLMEKGMVVAVNNPDTLLEIDSNFDVYCKIEGAMDITHIKVGTILSEDRSWFGKRDPDLDTVKQIVYLDDYHFGIKQLTRPLDEFNTFGDTVKVDILADYTHRLSYPSRYHDRDEYDN